MDSSSPLRESLAAQLRQSQAHAGLAAALESFPIALAGQQVPGHAHTAWQQVEHLRLAAEDLFAYCKDPQYEAREWPSGYWPQDSTPPMPDAWSASTQRLLEATEQMAQVVEDPAVDLYATVPAAEKSRHHVLRAALILLDHNSYHAAQLIALRQALKSWPPS